MLQQAFPAILALLPLASGKALSTAASCDRAALLAAADKYVSAQESGDPSLLFDLLAGNVTYRENNALFSFPSAAAASSPTTSAESIILTRPLPIDHRRTTADTIACATYTELISASGPEPYVIGTQIHHSLPGGVSNSSALPPISLIDTVAATTGAWAFNAAQTLRYASSENWTDLSPSSQVSRDVLVAAADAYLDIWSDASAEAKVPWGQPCARLEGGMYTGQGRATDSCRVGLPTNHGQKPNVDRRYVVDEVAGSCSVLCLWQHMMNAADSHEFRLEGGKLRYVHTITVCPGQLCKL